MIIKFNTTLFSAEPQFKGGIYFYTTPEVTTELGTAGKIRINGRLNGAPFTSVLLPSADGRHYAPVSADMQAVTGVKPGDQVEFEIEVDSGPTEVIIPPDLLAELAKHPEAYDKFDNLASSHKREYSKYFATAKKPKTKLRRSSRIIEMLLNRNYYKSK